MTAAKLAVSISDLATKEVFNGRMMTNLKVNQDFRVLLENGETLSIPKVRGWLNDTETKLITIFDVAGRKFKVEILGFVE